MRWRMHGHTTEVLLILTRMTYTSYTCKLLVTLLKRKNKDQKIKLVL
jgi:hypothetical protein